MKKCLAVLFCFAFIMGTASFVYAQPEEIPEEQTRPSPVKKTMKPGARGKAGMIGDTGMQNPTGQTGMIGDTGIQSPTGKTGIIGDSGIQNPAGKTGVIGDPGKR